MTCLAFQPVNEAITRDKPSYEENFSTSKNSFFGSFCDIISSNYFENGKYYINVFPMKNSSAEWARMISKDFRLEVEATQVSGPNDNGYGVVFGSNDFKDYYYFLISGDGYYMVSRMINDVWSDELNNQWTKSDAINKGNATNLIEIACNDGNFSFFINDMLVFEFSDPNSDENTIGLIAETMNTPGTVTVNFDNLKIWETSPQLDEEEQ
jgi:hypothetical protein